MKAPDLSQIRSFLQSLMENLRVGLREKLLPFLKETAKCAVRYEYGVLMFLMVMAILVAVPVVGHYLPLYRQLSAAFWALCGAYAVVIALKQKTRMELAYVVMGVILLYITLMTILNSKGSLELLVYRFVPVVGASLFAFAMRKEYKQIGAVLTVFFTILLIADLISMIIFPGGIFGSLSGPSWVLGYKNNRIDYLLVLMAFSAIRAVGKGKKELIFFAAVSLLSLLDIYLTDCSSGMGGVVLGALLMTLTILMPQRAGVMRKYIPIMVLYLLLVLSLVVLRANGFVGQAITAIFGKSPTFTGRTAIWDACIAAIADSNLLGLGRISASAFYAITNGFPNAHNLILEYAMLGGVPAVIGLLAVYGMKVMGSGCSQRNYAYIAVLYSLFLVGFMSAVFAYSPLFFMILFLLDKDVLDDEVIAPAQPYSRRRSGSRGQTGGRRTFSSKRTGARSSSRNRVSREGSSACRRASSSSSRRSRRS